MGQLGLMSLGPAWHLEDCCETRMFTWPDCGPGPATDQNHVTVATWPDNPEACITLCVKPSQERLFDNRMPQDIRTGEVGVKLLFLSNSGEYYSGVIPVFLETYMHKVCSTLLPTNKHTLRTSTHSISMIVHHAWHIHCCDPTQVISACDCMNWTMIETTVCIKLLVTVLTALLKPVSSKSTYCVHCPCDRMQRSCTHCHCDRMHMSIHCYNQAV